MKLSNAFRLLIVCEHEINFKEASEVLSKDNHFFHEFYCKTFITFSRAVHSNEKEPHVIIIAGTTPQLSPEIISNYLEEYRIYIPVLWIVHPDQEDLAVSYFPAVIDDYILTTQKKHLPISILALANKKTGHKIQENSLRYMIESEKKWAAIFNSEPAFVFVIRPEGNIAEINPSGLLCLEIKNNTKILNKNIISFIHKEDRRAFKQFHQSVSRGKQCSQQFRFTGLNGKICSVLAHGTPLRDNEQRVLSILIIAQDINNLISTQSGLTPHEQNKSALADSLPVGIFHTDAAGGYLHVNPFWSKLSGMSLEHACGQGWLHAIHPDDKNFVEKNWNHCVINQIPFHEEFRFLTPEGEINWAFSSAVLTRNEKGEPSGYLGTTTDINDNKLFEKALVESQSRLEAAQELAKVGDWDFDLGSQRFSWSKEMYPIHARNPMIGPPDFNEFISLVHPEDQEKVKTFFRQVINNGHAIGEDYRIVLKDCNLTQVYPTAYCMFDSEGNATKMIGTLIDVTERVKSHESIRNKEQLIDTIFSQSLDGMFVVKLDKPTDWQEADKRRLIPEDILRKNRFTRANDRFFSIHGITETELMTWSIYDYLLFKNIPYEHHTWLDFLNNGRTRFETRSKNNKGSDYWIQGDYMCIYDIQGYITGIIGFEKDITNEKTALEELKFSERNFREVFENSPDGIYIEDYNGVILNLNAEACRLQQLQKEELIGKNIIDITPDEQKEMVRNNFMKFCTGTIDRLETYSWDRDWHPIPVEIKVSHINYSGTPAILLHVRNIRLKKTIEQNYLTGFESAVKSADAGLWEWNLITGACKTSGMEIRLLGYNTNEITPVISSWKELIHPEDLDMVKDQIRDHLKNKTNFIETTLRVKKNSGQYLSLICRGSISEKDHEGIPIRMAGIILVVKNMINYKITL